jgi:hypothetical protein
LKEGIVNIDPVSTAVISCLSFSGTEAAKSVVRDLYENLKKAIFNKTFDRKKDFEVALEGLECEPDSDVYPMLFAETVKKTGLASDAEIVELVQCILAEIQKSGSGSGSTGGVQTATGSYIAQADRGGSAQVHVNQEKKSKRE